MLVDAQAVYDLATSLVFFKGLEVANLRNRVDCNQAITFTRNWQG